MWVDPGSMGGGMAGAFMLGMFMSGLDCCVPASMFSNHCPSQDGDWTFIVPSPVLIAMVG